jgi:hypothetical protein
LHKAVLEIGIVVQWKWHFFDRPELTDIMQLLVLNPENIPHDPAHSESIYVIKTLGTPS